MSISLFSLMVLNASSVIDQVRIALERNSAFWFSLVKYSGYAVAFGCLLEAPETFVLIKRWWFLRFRNDRHEETDEDKRSWIVPLAAIGLIVIVVGIVAETFFEGKVSDVESDIRTHESEKITIAEGNASSAIREVGTAKDSALIAEGASQTAKKVSDKAALTAKGAEQIARNARKEADTFEKDIVLAKQQAAQAESHLADALERAAHAEKQLTDLHSPRSLSDIGAFDAAIKPFAGTEYTVRVFQDDESIKFAIILDEALRKGGWLRKQSGILRIGVTSLNIFGQDRKDMVEICSDEGVHLYVNSSIPFEKLNTLSELPRVEQAAVSLQVIGLKSISPKTESNFGVVEVVPAKEGPVVICVGRKPL